MSDSGVGFTSLETSFPAYINIRNGDGDNVVISVRSIGEQHVSEITLWREDYYKLIDEFMLHRPT